MAKASTEHIERLLRMLQNSDASELEVETSTWRLRARRHIAAVMPSAQATAVERDETPPEPKWALIRSPLVGYFEPRSKPLAVGDVVHEGEVVCMIRAMGLMNEVRSPVAGKVAEVLVEDGIAVEYGQPLYKLIEGEADATQS